MAERALPDLRARLQLDTTDLNRASQNVRAFSQDLQRSMASAEQSLQRIPTHVRGLENALRSVADTTVRALAPVGKSLERVGSDALAGFGQGVQSGLAPVGRSLQAAGGSVGGSFGRGFESGLGPGQKAAEDALSRISGLASTLGRGVETGLAPARSALGWIESHAPVAGNALSGLASNTVNAFAPVGRIVNQAFSSIQAGFEIVGRTSSSVGRGVEAGLAPVQQVLLALAQHTGDAASALGSLSSRGVSSLGNLAVQGSSAVARLGSSMVTDLGAASGAVVGFGRGLGITLAPIGQLFQATANQAGVLGRGVSSGFSVVGSAFSSVADQAGVLGRGIASSLAPVGSALSFVQGTALNLGSGFAAMTARTINSVSEMGRGIQAGVNFVRPALDGLGSVMNGVADRAGSAFSSIRNAAEGAGRTVAVTFAAASAAAIGFVGQAAMVALRASEMDVALQALAKANKVSAASLETYVTAIRKQGIEIGVAQNLVAEFVQGHLDLAKAQDLARVAQDAAVISGQNSTATLAQLVQGIRTQQIDVLRSAGITISAADAYKQYAQAHHIAETAITETQKQQILLDEVLKQGISIQGAYAAALETPSKQLRSIPRLLNDISLNIGQAFEPALGKVITTGYKFALMFSAATMAGAPLRVVLDQAGAALTRLLAPLDRLVPRVKEFLDQLTAEKVASFTRVVGELTPILSAAGAAMAALSLRSIPFVGQFLPAINPILAAIAALVVTTPQLRELAAAVGELLGQAFGLFKTVAQPALEGLGKAVGTNLLPVMTTLTGIFKEINKDVEAGVPWWTTLAGALSAAGLKTADVSTVVGSLHAAFDKIGPVVHDVIGFFGTLWEKANKVADVVTVMVTTAWPQLQTAFSNIAGSFTTVAGGFANVGGAAGTAAGQIDSLTEGTNRSRDGFTRFMTSPSVLDTLTFFAVTLPTAIGVAASWLKVIADAFDIMLNQIAVIVRVTGDIIKGDWGKAMSDMNAYFETNKSLTLQGAVDLKTALTATWGTMDGELEARQASFKETMIGLASQTHAGTQEQAVQMKHEYLQTMREMHEEAVGHSIIPDMVNEILWWFGHMHDQGGSLFDSLHDHVISAANGLASGVGDAMSGLGGKVHGGLDSVRGVFNNFAGAANKVLGNFSITIGTIPEFAQGGVLPGYAPGQDTVLAALSPGEGVLTPQTVRGLGGAGAIEALNQNEGRGLHGIGAALANDVGAIVGSIAGQCVVAVENWTGHYFPVAFASQMTRWVNSQIPLPGSIFVSTIPPLGHTGIVLGGGQVIDSNWGLDERVRIHSLSDIPDIAGYILSFPANLGALGSIAAASVADAVKILITPAVNAAHGVANSISEPWARAIANSLIDKIASGVAHRATGGPVSAGSPYAVGEHGTELFVPSQDGSIIPNNALVPWLQRTLTPPVKAFSDAVNKLSDSVVDSTTKLVDALQPVISNLSSGLKKAEDGSLVPSGFYAQTDLTPVIPPGFTRAEDGSIVPLSFYNQTDLIPVPLLPPAPGYTTAEDGSIVPLSFYDQTDLTPVVLPGRAAGGPVVPGRVYMVGERGPELFSSSSSGSIQPHEGGLSSLLERVEQAVLAGNRILARIDGTPGLSATSASRRYAT